MGSNHDEEPILDIVLDEVKRWVAGSGRVDSSTAMSIHARSAAILTVLHIIAFSVAKISLVSWSAAQATCLIPLLGLLLHVRLNARTRRRNAGGVLPVNFATSLVGPANVTLGAIPFVLIIGIPKASGIDLGVYAVLTVTTILLFRHAWRVATARQHGAYRP